MKIQVNLSQDDWMVVVCALRRQRDDARKKGMETNALGKVAKELELELDKIRYGMVKQAGSEIPAKAVL